MTGHHRYIGKDRDCYEIVKEMQKIYGGMWMEGGGGEREGKCFGSLWRKGG